MDKDILIPVEIGGVKFKNPFFVASGPTTKSVEQLLRIERAGWAAASIKLTIDPDPYINRVPRYAVFRDRNALAFTAEKRLNFEQGLKLVERAKKRLTDLILLANITYAGDKGIDGWVNMAKRFEEVGADIIELNMCCPNMSYNLELTQVDSSASSIRTGASLGQQEEAIAEIVKAIKRSIHIPVFVKLTPEGGRISQIARVLYAAGADAVGGTGNRLAIPPINLEHPEMAVYHLQDEISMSCHSGSWLKPLALRDTYEIRKMNGSTPRIMAAGGIKDYKDALEMIMCGADLIGICAETLISGFDFIKDEIKLLKNWMEEHGYGDIREVRDLIVSEVKTAPELTLYKGYAQIIEPNLQAPCKSACPIHVPAQAYIQKVAKKKYKEAFELITGTSPLQSICSFVCNQPCEDVCIRGENGRPVRIKDIKRFVLEYGKNIGWNGNPKMKALNGKKAAVIGSGPSSISNAFYLLKEGYKVTMFEGSDELGGSLRYTTPSYRLPREIIDYEFNILKNMGMEIKTCCQLGRDITIASLKEDKFDAIFIENTLNDSYDLEIDIEKSENVLDGESFLQRVSNKEKVEIGQKVIVLGDDLIAIDSARTARRIGAKEVYVISKLKRDGYIGFAEHISHAEAEGINFIYSTSIKEILLEESKANRIILATSILGIPNQTITFDMYCDTIIKVSKPNLNLIGDIQFKDGVCFGKGLIEDVITAAATGRKVAALMDRHVFGEKASIEYIVEAPTVNKDIVLERVGFLKNDSDINLVTRAGEDRIKDFEEYTRVMTEAEVEYEASRCLACGCGEGCGICMKICSEFCIYVNEPDIIKIGSKGCVACGMCYNMCPLNNIEMVNTGEKV